MNSTTPQFDALLQPILDALVPHTRTCGNAGNSIYCEKQFTLAEEDISFLRKLKSLPPEYCPTCRRQGRLLFHNPVFLFKRNNDAPSEKSTVLSFVSPVKPFTIYDYEYYTSGLWDPLAFGRVFDENTSFLDQLYELRKVVPQPAMTRDPSNVNSEYSINGRNAKNAYCSSAVFGSEDIWYSINVKDSREVMDSNKVVHMEQVYHAVCSRNCSRCQYVFFSQQCINVQYTYDCRNCQDCFGCVNLRNKRYCLFNVQLSKEEYERQVGLYALDKASVRTEIEKKFWDFVRQHPVKASRNEQSIDSTGTYVVHSKNCHDATDCDSSENERHVDIVVHHKDSMDVCGSGGSELLYQTSGVGSQCSNVKFSALSKFITDSEYLVNCRHCSYCFGCVGLENKSYVIFNKQYTEDEYWIELDRIKSALVRTGEYGRMLESRFSPFAYNASSADIAFPLTEDGTLASGFEWQVPVDTDTSGLDVLSWEQVPDSITDVSGDIQNHALLCKETGRPFRIVPTELTYYKRYQIPLPTTHQYHRMKKSFSYFGNMRSYPGVCTRCACQLQTIYSPESHMMLYCDECYQKEVL